MCFNATSSFLAAAVLIPAGLYTLHAARHVNSHYRLLAAFPLLFGVQQALEGVLWLEILPDAAGEIGGLAFGSALGFLFFAYFLWPGLVPLAAWRVEPPGLRRRVFAAAAIMGGLLGGSLFLPLIINPDWLQVFIIRGSILYHPQLIYDPWMDREVVRAIYALIVAVPLIGSSDRMVRDFGVLILGSVIVSTLAFGYAFVSIWCFFAALLSAYLVVRLPRCESGGPVVHRPGSSRVG
ncbi:DUF6629 family protein [Thiocapsa sp. UBA6158]|jgi:hypothetical protein|uniref:DUF6629 family protein n=1 Tax=Thiocapsa sp. UBA6158 TaxID=1947692 RepID=UPI002600EC15|nr:DUF6629 family protein [Thiocapsa sp. UBA6158]